MTSPASLTFASALDRYIIRGGVRVTALAEAVGVTPAAISSMRRGRHLPTLETGERLADALMAPPLVELLIKLRTTTCVICGRSVLHVSGPTRTYCSATCRSRNRRSGKRVLPKAVLERDAAIAAMCASCEPTGICRTEDCPLRAYSPLPYIAPQDVGVLRRGDHYADAWTPTRRAALSVSRREFWAQGDRRTALAERIAETWRDPAIRARRTAGTVEAWRRRKGAA